MVTNHTAADMHGLIVLIASRMDDALRVDGLPEGARQLIADAAHDLATVDAWLNPDRDG